MGKRLTDTEVWDQDWFIDLPNKYKLCFFFIKDKCDSAGIWRPNKSLLQRIITEPLNLEEFLAFTNLGKERIKVLPSGRWFLIDFFVFQYGDKFSPTSKVHKGVLKQLLANGVHPAELIKLDTGKLKTVDIQELKDIAYCKDIDRLSIAYGNPINRTKEKDKEKDKEDEIVEGIEDKGGLGEKGGKGEEREDHTAPPQMLMPQMHNIWISTFPTYTANQSMDYPALKTIADFILKTAGISNGIGNADHEIKILNTFQLIADQVNRETFWVNKPLTSISKNIQEFYNKIKNPINGTGSKQAKSGATVSEDVLKQKATEYLNQRRQGGQNGR